MEQDCHKRNGVVLGVIESIETIVLRITRRRESTSYSLARQANISCLNALVFASRQSVVAVGILPISC